MPSVVTCQCGKAFNAADHLAGKTLPCPACGGRLTIPGPSQPVAAVVAVLCFKCGTGFRVDGRLAGRNVDCPRCGGSIAVPKRAANVATDSILPDAAADLGVAAGRPPASLRERWANRSRFQFLPLQRLGFLIAGGLLLLSGPISGFFAWSLLAKANAAAEWPQAPGEIMRSQVRGGEHAFDAKYSVEIMYRYEADGMIRTGERVRATDGEFSDRKSVEKIVRHYPAGKHVEVYYNPSDPDDAMLEVGAGFQEFGLLAVTVMMFLAGVGILVFVIEFTE